MIDLIHQAHELLTQYVKALRGGDAKKYVKTIPKNIALKDVKFALPNACHTIFDKLKLTCIKQNKRSYLFNAKINNISTYLVHVQTYINKDDAPDSSSDINKALLLLMNLNNNTLDKADLFTSLPTPLVNFDAEMSTMPDIIKDIIVKFDKAEVVNVSVFPTYDRQWISLKSYLRDTELTIDMFVSLIRHIISLKSALPKLSLSKLSVDHIIYDKHDHFMIYNIRASRMLDKTDDVSDDVKSLFASLQSDKIKLNKRVHAFIEDQLKSFNIDTLTDKFINLIEGGNASVSEEHMPLSPIEIDIYDEGEDTGDDSDKPPITKMALMDKVYGGGGIENLPPHLRQELSMSGTLIETPEHMDNHPDVNMPSVPQWHVRRDGDTQSSTPQYGMQGMQGMQGMPPQYGMQGMQGMPPQYGMQGMPPQYGMQGMQGMPPPGVQHGMQDMPPQGMQHSMQDMHPQGMQHGMQHGMPPQGMPPQGMPPQGMPPQGMPPQYGMQSASPNMQDPPLNTQSHHMRHLLQQDTPPDMPSWHDQ